jgi:serine/threonine protein kinase
MWGGRTRFFGGKSMQQFNLDPEDSSDGDADRQAVERMTRVCEAFRRDLQANRLARLEDFLDQIPQKWRAEALRRLLTIEDKHRVATEGKRLSNDEVLVRFPNSPDREVVEAWLGQRTTQLFDETKVDRPTHREEQSNGTQAKRYSGQDFPGHDFDLFEELGAGGQGQVYRVFDKRCSTLRAVKIFEAIKGRSRTYGSDLQNREAQHLARLRERGAAVLTVHHAGETAAGARYLVMDYCKRGSLDGLIDDRWDEDLRRPVLTWQECADLVAKLARTLEVVHAEGLYHFDIKPANILIGNDGAPLLADFAGSIDHIEFLGGGNIGWTWAYAAPEIRAVADGAERKADGRTDLYSLGVVFYELLTGKLATESPVRPQPPGQLRPEIPEDVDRLCLEMLEQDFEKRINSAKKVADRLERTLQRDANPPMKRVKTAAMWGGWVATLVLSFWMGTQLYSALWNLRADPKPRIVVSDPASPPALVAIPGERGALDSQLFVRTGSPILIRYDQVGDRRISDIQFTIRQPPLGGFGLFHDLVLNPQKGIAAEFELVYFEMPALPLHPEMPTCGNETFLMTVSFERFQIRESPWRLEAVGGANVFDQPVCFSKKRDVHEISIRFSEESGEFRAVGVDGNWTEFPTPAPLGAGGELVRHRPRLQKEFGLLVRVGDLVLSPEISVREKP